MSSANTDTAEDLVFRALAAPVRRAILDALKDNPQTTGELCARFPEIDRCTVMQHLKVLEGADLVLTRKIGRVRWNYLNALPIRDIHERWIGPYAAYAVDLLARMKTRVEAGAPQPPPSTGRPKARTATAVSRKSR